MLCIDEICASNELYNKYYTNLDTPIYNFSKITIDSTPIAVAGGTSTSVFIQRKLHLLNLIFNKSSYNDRNIIKKEINQTFNDLIRW